MKILEDQHAEIWRQGTGLDGMYRHIERAARVCYQSNDLIKEKSYVSIIKALIDKNHTSMLEHGTIYLERTLPDPSYFSDESKYFSEKEAFDEFVNKYLLNKFSEVFVNQYHDYVAITTNYRVIYENKWDDDLSYMCKPSTFHSKRTTICVTTNLQVATEYIRQRLFSYAMESTRYCAYDKEKFGNELSFIFPLWLKEDNVDKMVVIEWLNAMQDAENHYMRLRDMGWTAEKCAQVLPKATKTTLVITGTESLWNHLLDLRYFEKTGPAHPQAKELAGKIYDLLK